MENLKDEEDSKDLLIAFAKDKKGAEMTANQKKQLGLFNKAVFGSETGKPSGSGASAADLAAATAIIDAKRAKMTEAERAAQDAYGETLSEAQ